MNLPSQSRFRLSNPSPPPEAVKSARLVPTGRALEHFVECPAALVLFRRSYGGVTPTPCTTTSGGVATAGPPQTFSDQSSEQSLVSPSVHLPIPVLNEAKL